MATVYDRATAHWVFKPVAIVLINERNIVARARECNPRVDIER